MIWLTWRQHRKQALAALIGLAVLAAALIPTGLAMRHTVTDLGLPACVRAMSADLVSRAQAATCNAAAERFDNSYGSLVDIVVLFLFLPLLAGLFWGAPLVAREIEHGTHRMVWTQGVSRRRWTMAKFGLVGGAVLVLAAIYGLALTWWLVPLSQAGYGRFDSLRFDMQGLVPIGYALFAVALGIFAGTVWRRILPTMAATLVGFVGLRVAVGFLARPHFMSPHTFTFAVRATDVSPPRDGAGGNWILTEQVRNANGDVLVPNDVLGCPPDLPHCGPGNIGAGAYNWIQYQPADRFWPFQAIETGIFVALAALLVYLAVRRIRKVA